jgi:hypothetical protein
MQLKICQRWGNYDIHFHFSLRHLKNGFEWRTDRKFLRNPNLNEIKVAPAIRTTVAPVSYYCLIFFIGLRPKLGNTYYRYLFNLLFSVCSSFEEDEEHRKFLRNPNLNEISATCTTPAKHNPHYLIFRKSCVTLFINTADNLNNWITLLQFY